MVNAFISGLTAGGALDGNELLEVSQLSASVTITASTLSAQASDNSFNDSGSGFVAAGFAVGDRVNVTGFTGDVANNIFAATITALTTGKMTIGGTDGDVIVDDAAGESVTITKWVTHRVTAREIAGLAGGWAPNFTDDGDLYIPAEVAMTIDQGNAEIGTGTITYEKSTNAAPGTFSSTTLPATLEAGAWLKVIAASVTGFVATHLVRTA